MDRHKLTERFRAQHVPGMPVVMPNPWDIGSAKVMARLGAQALATTSSGHGFTLGLVDGGQVTREVALQHAADICAAVDVPVNGDFENGFGDSPETVAETVRLAAEVGLAGVSIEDSAVPSKTSYPFDLALERIEAAVAAARAVGIVLTARADGWLLRSYCNRWVFPSPKSAMGHITGPERMRWNPHSHRRTFATVAMEAGILEEIVGRLLNHTPLSITGQRYAMPSLDALRPSMEVVCEELQRRVGEG